MLKFLNFQTEKENEKKMRGHHFHWLDRNELHNFNSKENAFTLLCIVAYVIRIYNVCVNL